MNQVKNILLLFGGGESEHEISILTANFLESKLKYIENIKIHKLELKNESIQKLTPQFLEDIDFVIPCIHGPPGESGEIQSFLKLQKIPFMGCDSYSSQKCFDKISTKLWLKALKIPNTPFEILSSLDDLPKAFSAFEKWNGLFIKANTQGSSIGCYLVQEREKLEKQIKLAFNFSPYVLIEKIMKARELEIAVFEYEGKLHVTDPGEILTEDGIFYDYEQKYNKSSKTKTLTQVSDLPDQKLKLIKKYAREAFIQLKLKDLARVDFFYLDNGDIYLNEINTFPGMAPISMFPKMMSSYGIRFEDYLKDIIHKNF